MCQKEIFPSAELIYKEIKELSAERRTIFIRWLENHIGLEEFNAEEKVQERINTWLYSLTPGEAIEEHSLMIAEISWCAKVSIHTLRRIASAERLENRRSLDE
jgi:hypothetical protein